MTTITETVPVTLEGLNPAQREAVLFGDGPLLIVAGAGTGKTTVLARRIAHLVISKKALPREILALTFTDRAANEMEERVDRLLPYGFNDVWISTFHSFGDKVLRENAFEIGLTPDLRVLTQPEAVVFLRERLFDLDLKFYRPLSDPTRFVESLLTTFSRAKDEEVSPEEFIRAAEKALKGANEEEEKEKAVKMLEVGRAYEAYEKLKTAKGFVDFGDQVLLALKILRKSAAALKKIQDRYKYILVDEFQDTNFGQFELVKRIASLRRNITVVGDDDQSIYKFRGACLSNILGFRKSYPEAKQIILLDNYRSTQDILDVAWRLIQHNNPDRLEYQDNLNKQLRSQKGPGEPVRYTHHETHFSESEFIVQDIQRRLANGACEPKDLAVLVRTNAGAEPFMKSLTLAGIPWRFSGNAGLYEQEEIRVILSFLRALDQPDDSASLYYLATSPLYRLDPEDCSKLTQLSVKTKRSLLDVFKNCRTLDPELALEKSTCDIIDKVISDLARFRKLAGQSPTGNLLYLFLEECGELKRLTQSQDPGSVQEAHNLQKFFQVIKKFGQVAKYDRVHTFIQYLEALRLAGEDPSSAEPTLDPDSVNLMTVHAAKGLEFDVVYLAGLEQGHFPVSDRGDWIEFPEELIKDVLPSGNYHLQEERRLFYVGMTRAKKELVLTSARDLGKKKLWKPSQFILEALDKPAFDEKALAREPLHSLKIFDSNPVPLPSPAAKPLAALQATAVEEYLSCPLKYKFSRVLRIPVLQHHSTVFGIAIHEALKAYNLVRKENRIFPLGEFLKVYKNAWRSEGFISREHEEQRFREGLKILRQFHKKESKLKAIPTLVEESFKMEVDRCKISGRWDRVDIAGEDSAVIDYKTGEVKDQKGADQKARDSTQLGLYAIAFKNRFGRYPSRMTLHFVKSGLQGTAVPSEEKIDKVFKKAQAAIAGIQKEDFQPIPSYLCRWCAFERICPAVRKGV